MKHEKNKRFSIEENENYLIDNAKLVINKKGEIIIVSTSATVDFFPFVDLVLYRCLGQKLTISP